MELARWLECRIRSTLLLTENSAVLKRSVSRQMQAEDRRRTRVGQKTRISSNASKTMLDQVTLHLLKNPNTWEWINVVALFAAGLTGRCFTVHIWTKAGSAHLNKSREPLRTCWETVFLEPTGSKICEFLEKWTTHLWKGPVPRRG